MVKDASSAVIKRIGKKYVIYYGKTNTSIPLTRENVIALGDNLMLKNGHGIIKTIGLSRAQIGTIIKTLSEEKKYKITCRKIETSPNNNALRFKIILSVMTD